MSVKLCSQEKTFHFYVNCKPIFIFNNKVKIINYTRIIYPFSGIVHQPKPK